MGDTKKAGGIHYEIMARCYNPNRIMYSKYGGRGIEVCEEWHDGETFKKWLYEQGFNGTQRLERIDATKDYSPENCRLGTKYKKKDKPPKPPKSPKEKEPSCVSKTYLQRIRNKHTKKRRPASQDPEPIKRAATCTQCNSRSELLCNDKILMFSLDNSKIYMLWSACQEETPPRERSAEQIET